jgi:hypothetical protein
MEEHGDIFPSPQGVELGFSPTPKSYTSWERGCLGHVDMPRALPKYEAKNGVEETKRRGTPKRLGHVIIRIKPSLGHANPNGCDG